MYSMQLESHIDKQGCLKLQLPEDWADANVNVVVVVEKKDLPDNATTNLNAAFELLSSMPDDFMKNDRQDNLPQEREALL